MIYTVWQAQPLHGSIVLNYCSSRSETRWIFTEEIEKYKCEFLYTIKKGIYRRPCEENKKMYWEKPGLRVLEWIVLASESCQKVYKFFFG